MQYAYTGPFLIYTAHISSLLYTVPPSLSVEMYVTDTKIYNKFLIEIYFAATPCKLLLVKKQSMPNESKKSLLKKLHFTLRIWKYKTGM